LFGVTVASKVAGVFKSPLPLTAKPVVVVVAGTGSMTKETGDDVEPWKVVVAPNAAVNENVPTGKETPDKMAVLLLPTVAVPNEVAPRKNSTVPDVGSTDPPSTVAVKSTVVPSVCGLVKDVAKDVVVVGRASYEAELMLANEFDGVVHVMVVAYSS
jgi:hypothetical protein